MLCRKSMYHVVIPEIWEVITQMFIMWKATKKRALYFRTRHTVNGTRSTVLCSPEAVRGEQDDCANCAHTLTRRCAVTHFREWMGERDAEGLSFVVTPDVTLQAVLAAKSLLTAVTRTVEWLLPYRTSRDKGRKYRMRPINLLIIIYFLYLSWKEKVIKILRCSLIKKMIHSYGLKSQPYSCHNNIKISREHGCLQVKSSQVYL